MKFFGQLSFLTFSNYNFSRKLFLILQSLEKKKTFIIEKISMILRIHNFCKNTCAISNKKTKIFINWQLRKLKHLIKLKYLQTT